LNDDLTEAEQIALVEAEIDRHQARRRVKRVTDAARAELRKQKGRRQGIPVESAQCAAVMQRAEEVLMRQKESAKPFRPFARAPEATLLTEDATETDRPLYPHSLPPDDGTLPRGAATGTFRSR
jgi:hypothetical protein